MATGSSRRATCRSASSGRDPRPVPAGAGRSRMRWPPRRRRRPPPAHHSSEAGRRAPPCRPVAAVPRRAGASAGDAPPGTTPSTEPAAAHRPTTGRRPSRTVRSSRPRRSPVGGAGLLVLLIVGCVVAGVGAIVGRDRRCRAGGCDEHADADPAASSGPATGASPRRPIRPGEAGRDALPVLLGLHDRRADLPVDAAADDRASAGSARPGPSTCSTPSTAASWPPRPPRPAPWTTTASRSSRAARWR